MSAYVIRQLRSDLDRARRALLAGEPVGIEFAHLHRQLGEALAYCARVGSDDRHYLQKLARLDPDRWSAP